MKKIVSFITAAVLMLSLLTVYAADYSSSITATNVTVHSGTSDVVISFSLDKKLSVQSGALSITLPEGFEWKEKAEKTSLLDKPEKTEWKLDAVLKSFGTMTDDKGVFVMMNESTVSGTIFTMVLDVASSVPAGTYDIVYDFQLRAKNDENYSLNQKKCTVTVAHTYSDAWTTDSTGHWHKCTKCSEKVNFSTHAYDNSCDTTCNVCGYERTLSVAGDLDGDDEVTEADAIYLLFHTFFEEDYPVSQDCDYDGDGEVTEADAIYLLFHTFFEEDYPI